MAGEHVELAPEVLDVHRQVRDRLRPIDQDRDAPRVRHLDEALHRIDGAEGVRHLRHRHQLRPLVQQRSVLVDQELAGVVDRDDAELGADLLAQDLPRHDVGVVLHGGDDDLVPRREERPPVALRHQVDPLGGTPDEDDLPGVCGMEEARYRATGVLVRGRRPFAQEVHAPMDVGVLRGVVPLDRVDHDPRLLAGGRVVEIHQRLAVHPLLQDREVLADAFHVERGGPGRPGGRRRHLAGRAHAGTPLAPLHPSSDWSRASSNRSSRPWSGAIVIRLTTSLANA